MINVTIFKDSKSQYKGFEVSGHAGYSESGTDIVCAAVSILTVNAANSIESFTDDIFDVNCNDDGYLKLLLCDNVSNESRLLIDSMILGLNSVIESYGGKYLKISYKEV